MSRISLYKVFFNPRREGGGGTVTDTSYLINDLSLNINNVTAPTGFDAINELTVTHKPVANNITVTHIYESLDDSYSYITSDYGAIKKTNFIWDIAFPLHNGMKFVSARALPSYFNATNVTNMNKMFYNLTALTTVNTLDFRNTCQNVINGDEIFAYSTKIKEVKNINLENATSLVDTFWGCTALISAEIEAPKVTSVSHLFEDCNIVNNIVLNTPKCMNYSSCFRECFALKNVELTNTSGTGVGVNFAGLFILCSGLEEAPSFDASNGTNFNGLFNGCTSLKKVPALDTHNGTIFQATFYNCSNLEEVAGIDLTNANASNITNFLYGTYNRLTKFILNGSLNISFSFSLLTVIDYDSIKSILTAASNTINTNTKTLAFNRTITDQGGELAALVSQCITKGWTITGLTIN